MISLDPFVFTQKGPPRAWWRHRELLNFQSHINKHYKLTENVEVLRKDSKSNMPFVDVCCFVSNILVQCQELPVPDWSSSARADRLDHAKALQRLLQRCGQETGVPHSKGRTRGLDANRSCRRWALLLSSQCSKGWTLDKRCWKSCCFHVFFFLPGGLHPTVLSWKLYKFDPKKTCQVSSIILNLDKRPNHISRTLAESRSTKEVFSTTSSIWRSLM